MPQIIKESVKIIHKVRNFSRICTGFISLYALTIFTNCEYLCCTNVFAFLEIALKEILSSQKNLVFKEVEQFCFGSRELNNMAIFV